MYKIELIDNRNKDVLARKEFPILQQAKEYAESLELENEYEEIIFYKDNKVVTEDEL